MEAIQAPIRAEGTLAGLHSWVTAAEMSSPVGGQRSQLLSSIRLWGYFIVSLTKWSLSAWSLRRFFFSNSLFPLKANRTPWPLDVPERLKNIEAQRRLLFSFHPFWHLCFNPPRKVDAAIGIVSTACHCGSYFPKDYCLWPLPLGQSWYHSHRPWLQRLTVRRGGNHHSPSNPHSLLWEWEDLLTGHHSAHRFSLSSISVSSLSHAHQAA